MVRGLIGPREAPRIWDRHLLNCAAVAELIPSGATVLDVGSGAGLPGIVLAVARPDLTVTLVEPLARRTSFLIEAVRATRPGQDGHGGPGPGRGGRQRIERRGRQRRRGHRPRGRAAGPAGRWCLPLAAAGGRLLALKGSSAADEIAEHAEVVARLGGGEPVVQLCGVGVIDPPTTVVEIVRERMVGPARPAAKKRARGGRVPPSGDTSRHRASGRWVASLHRYGWTTADENPTWTGRARPP